MSTAIDTLMFATLSADPTLTGLVGSQIYFGELPNNFTYDSAVLQMRRIGGLPHNHLGGQSGLRNPTYQMDVYARTSDLAYDVDDAVRAVIVPAPNANGFTSVYETEPAVEYEDDRSDYRLTATLAVWWRA